MRERTPATARLIQIYQTAYAHLTSFLSSKSMAERGIYRGDESHRAVMAHREGKLDISGRVFRVVRFELSCHLLETGRSGQAESPPGGAHCDWQAETRPQ
jgi:hypothetical protein